jgi:dGTPase
MAELRRFMFDEVYLGPAARREAEKVDRLVHDLFDAYVRDPSRLPEPVVDADLPQRVTDYIAGMTDRFATRLFTHLTVPAEFAS